MKSFHVVAITSMKAGANGEHFIVNQRIMMEYLVAEPIHRIVNHKTQTSVYVKRNLNAKQMNTIHHANSEKTLKNNSTLKTKDKMIKGAK